MYSRQYLKLLKACEKAMPSKVYPTWLDCSFPRNNEEPVWRGNIQNKTYISIWIQDGEIIASNLRQIRS